MMTWAVQYTQHVESLYLLQAENEEDAARRGAQLLAAGVAPDDVTIFTTQTKVLPQVVAEDEG